MAIGYKFLKPKPSIKGVEMTALEKMIFSVYDAVGNEENWTAFLSDLANEFNSARSSLSIEDERSQFPYRFLTHGWEDGDLDPYQEYYYTKDVWIQLLAQNAHNRFLAGESVISHSKFKHTEGFTDYLKPFGIEHASGAYIGSFNGIKIRIALQRDGRQGQFQREEIDRLNLLAPHLSKAIELQNILDQQDNHILTINDMLDSIAQGAVITDAKSTILHINAKAESLLTTSKLLSRNHNKISIKDHKKQTQLDDLIAQEATLLHAEKSSSVRIESEELNEGYVFEVKPYLVKSRFLGPNTMTNGALILIKPTYFDNECLEKIAQFYQFTSAESLIVKCLCEGKSTTQISDELSRSPHTVQTHIKNLLKKTNFNDQRQLIADVFKAI